MPGHLPTPLTSFIGREQELGEITRLLRESRLLTLTGPGGTGKTRLALEVARQVTPALADGLVFVGLAALGVPEAAGISLGERLRASLRSKQLLLVLDNFEQVVTAAPLVTTLMEGCPDLKVLVTSRAALHVGGEQEYRLGPLALPGREDVVTLATVPRYAALTLFIQRARAVRHDFPVTNDTLSTIAAICGRLDGLPLALELAAARSPVLTSQALLARLEQRLPLLTGGARDAPARQETLRDTIAWSYELLVPAEQTLFRRLAVFSGGCTLDAVIAVCDADKSGEVALLDRMTALVEQSLLERTVGQDRELRFGLLETVREYALERLIASGEVAAVQRLHAAYFLAMAETAAPDVNTFRVSEAWLPLLEAEHDNLRAALAWSLTADDHGDQALRLAGALSAFWNPRGYLSEGRSWQERAIAVGLAAPAASRARALAGAAAFAWFQTDYPVAQALAEQALRLWQALGDAAGTAYALDLLSTAHSMRGSLPPARTLSEQSVALFRGTGSQSGLMRALNNLAMVARLQRDYPAATAAAEEELALARAQADRSFVAFATRHLGRLAFEQHDTTQARRLLAESLALYRQQADHWQVGVTLPDLAHIALIEGEAAAATAYGEEALGLLREIGATTIVARALEVLGCAARVAGENYRAAACYRESFEVFRTNGKRPSSYGLAGLAWTALWLGRPSAAARLLAAVHAALDTQSTWGDVAHRFYQTDVAAAPAALGEEAFAASWAAGEALSPEQVLAEALALPAAPAAAPEGPSPRTKAATPRFPDGLTVREVEVLRLIAAGKSTREIAAALVISEGTVERHVTNLYGKVGCTNRVEATTYAQRRRLVG